MILPDAAIDILLAVIAFGLVLIPAIIIHELGISSPPDSSVSTYSNSV